MLCFEYIKMHEVVNKFLLAGDKFTLEMHSNQPGFIYSASSPLQRAKKKLKRLCRLKIQVLFTKTSLMKPVFNMIWLMFNQKVYKKELNQTKF